MKNAEFLETLRQACMERKVCRVHLSGEPAERLVNPHGVCYSKKGTMILVCILVRGYTESKNPTSNYRNLVFEKLAKVEMLSRSFTIDPSFDPESDQYTDWLFHVLTQ